MFNQLLYALTNPKRQHLMLGCTVLVALVGVGFITAYHEWGASWFGITIWPFAFLIASGVAGIARKRGLFDPNDITPNWMVGLTVGYVLFSIILGLIFTEPVVQQANAVQQSQSQEYDYHNTRAGGIYYFISSGSSSSSSSASAPSFHTSSGKGSGYVILLLILLLLVFAAAVIPHFWVVSIVIGVVLLTLFTRKDYIVNV